VLIVFICTGNICRSAMAEAIARHVVQEKGITGLKFSSMGVEALIQSPADENAIAALEEINIDLTQHRGRYLVFKELSEAEIILCMDRYHLSFIKGMFPQLAYKCYLLTDYPKPRWIKKDITDPYCKSLEKFRQSRDIISENVTRILAEFGV
jgi:protein-tyrosine-phosphatase